MNKLHFRPRALIISAGPFRLSFSVIWLALIPAALWSLSAFVIPLSAPSLTAAETWAASAAACVILLLSLVLHTLGHGLAARLTRTPLPAAIPIEPFGDAAQVWPPSATPLRDTIVGMAGPVVSGAQAGLWALLWNLQIHPAINALSFLAVTINITLSLINLAPASPLDGGRTLRAILWGDFGLPTRAAQIGQIAGFVLVGGLAAWGVFLITLSARFSIETGAGTLAFAAMLAWGLRHPSAPIPHTGENGTFSLIDSIGGGVLLLVQLFVAGSLIPMADGIYAPGPAVSVQPMITVPEERRTPAQGELLLTTVIAQTPITLGQWVLAKVQPAFTIVPPERVVPRDVTPQQLMRRNVQMLEESEATALVVGVRLAGFAADITSTALQVTSVAPESPSVDLIKPGDQILSIDGVLTPRLDLLRSELARHQAGESVALAIDRDGQQQAVQVTLMGPAEAGGPPRIGIGLQPVGLDVALPFPVTIEAKKVAGGPSAGLMFALATYDLLTPEDLTHGWQIAGTGTIALDGTVGPIGGIAQKVAGAEWAGADYFIVPREHEAEARSIARTIQLLPVSTIQEAIETLRNLPDHTRQ